MELLITGLGLHDFGLFVTRLTLGLFFILARFRWVYDPASTELADPAWSSDVRRWFTRKRRESLNHKMEYCGVAFPRVLGPFVAVAELAAGIGVIVGLLTPLAALALLVITIRATFCTACEKTMKQNPVDRIDVVSCYLWTPEPLYAVLALILVLFGAGAWSLDALL